MTKMNHEAFSKKYIMILSSILMKLKSKWTKVIIPLIGAGSLIWFLIRVIPKPSRASYPCMRVAAPLASGFVLWILGLAGSITAFSRMKSMFAQSSYLRGILFLIIGVGFTFLTLSQSSLDTFADTQDEVVIANNPIGDAKGINPGRVVWVWNPDATNENCTNSYNGDGVGNDYDDGWFLNKNNNQVEIDKMLSASILELTGERNDYEAWDKMFRYFNENKYNISSGYEGGQTVFIKTNATSTWGYGYTWGNITSDFNKNENNYYAIAETSPQLILSLLRQLINVYGIPEEMISVGDPMKFLYNHCYDLWHSEFPNVHYVQQISGSGREQVQPTSLPVIKYSDKGKVLSVTADKIYKAMNDADYLINVPTMKAHARAGITLFAKNHFGSHSRSSAEHLHPGLVSPDDNGAVRTETGMYRTQVDLMGHERLGGNTVFFLLDALYSGSEAVDPPTKWDMTPFNGDWTSSIFLSQDPVAIESVAYDFLSNEYNGADGKVNYPNMQGTTDYLRQAADPSYWPEDVIYDPDDDGIQLSGLGVNEHWNNPVDKEYTRNLRTGEGIELVTIFQDATDVYDDNANGSPISFELDQNYPNPFNPSTTISFTLSEKSAVRLEVYDMLGKLVAILYSGTKSAGAHTVKWNGVNRFGKFSASGNYIYRLHVDNGFQVIARSKLMTLLK